MSHGVVLGIIRAIVIVRVIGRLVITILRLGLVGRIGAASAVGERVVDEDGSHRGRRRRGRSSGDLVSDVVQRCGVLSWVDYRLADSPRPDAALSLGGCRPFLRLVRATRHQ